MSSIGYVRGGSQRSFPTRSALELWRPSSCGKNLPHEGQKADLTRFEGVFPLTGGHWKKGGEGPALSLDFLSGFFVLSNAEVLLHGSFQQDKLILEVGQSEACGFHLFAVSMSLYLQGHSAQGFSTDIG